MQESLFDRIQEFVIQNIKKFVDLEKEREKSLLEQSNRLLVFQTLLITALYSIISLIDDINNCIFTATAIITIIVLVSLIFNLLSQWRYKYNSVPNPQQMEIYEENHKTDFDIHKEYVETKTLMKQMGNSISKNNKKRVVLLKTAMVLTFVSIALIIALSITFFFKGDIMQKIEKKCFKGCETLCCENNNLDKNSINFNNSEGLVDEYYSELEPTIVCMKLERVEDAKKIREKIQNKDAEIVKVVLITKDGEKVNIDLQKNDYMALVLNRTREIKLSSLASTDLHRRMYRRCAARSHVLKPAKSLEKYLRRRSKQTKKEKQNE